MKFFIILLFLLSLTSLCLTTGLELSYDTTTSLSTSIAQKNEENCTPAAILEFPSDGFTKAQRRSGYVAIHFILSFYSIILLSMVCDDYFVPAIQALVQDLNIPEDIAGASFMAITSASPELFVNFVGTFITQGDIGVGTVVGSNVFNVLAVPACCLFSKLTFQLDWYSMTRDCLVYGISVVLLITTLWDDRVEWYEALIFVLVYFLYILVMYFNEKIQKLVRKKRSTSLSEVEEIKIIQSNGVAKVTEEVEISEETVIKPLYGEEDNLKDPESRSISRTIWKIITLPITSLFTWTIPDCKIFPKSYIYSLVMCMVWIGIGSYLLTWFITVIGDTLAIPDSVVGLTFVAVGSSIPEVVSCIIISRQGQGAMGISSALGANTFEILLCLGLPWLLKTVINPKNAGNHWITINSSGLAYNAGSLFSTLIFLYLCLLFNRFRLDWKLGITCLVGYILFLIIGTLIELNYFFTVNLPTCEILK